MKLTAEEGREVVFDDHADWATVPGTRRAVEHTRWSVIYEAVFYHKPTDKHYSLSWGVGATESQDERPFEYDEPEPEEVELREVTEKKWVGV